VVQKVDRAEHGLNYRGALEEDLREYNCSMHFRHDTMLRTGPLSQIVDTHCAYHNLGRRSRLGCSGAAVMVANHHQAALVEHHSHICKSSLCMKRCTPSIPSATGQINLVRTCVEVPAPLIWCCTWSITADLCPAHCQIDNTGNICGCQDQNIWPWISRG